MEQLIEYSRLLTEKLYVYTKHAGISDVNVTIKIITDLIFICFDMTHHLLGVILPQGRKDTLQSSMNTQHLNDSGDKDLITDCPQFLSQSSQFHRVYLAAMLANFLQLTVIMPLNGSGSSPAKMQIILFSGSKQCYLQSSERGYI